VAAALESPKLSQAAALGVFALIGRLRTSVGALIGVDTPHALEQPTVIVEEVLHGVLTWPTLADLGQQRGKLLVAATRAAAITLDVPWPDVARAVWLSWDAAERRRKARISCCLKTMSKLVLGAHSARAAPAAARRRARQADAVRAAARRTVGRIEEAVLDARSP